MFNFFSRLGKVAFAAPAKVVETVAKEVDDPSNLANDENEDNIDLSSSDDEIKRYDNNDDNSDDDDGSNDDDSTRRSDDDPIDEVC